MIAGASIRGLTVSIYTANRVKSRCHCLFYRCVHSSLSHSYIRSTFLKKATLWLSPSLPSQLQGLFLPLVAGGNPIVLLPPPLPLFIPSKTVLQVENTSYSSFSHSLTLFPSFTSSSSFLPLLSSVPLPFPLVQ